MKYLSVFFLFLSSLAWAKPTVPFNEALQEDLAQEIKQDDFKYKKKSFRAPASVEENSPAKSIKPPSKLEKVRQIGPNQW